MTTDASWDDWQAASAAARGEGVPLASMGDAPTPSFSQRQWEVAQQEGCPSQTFPTWPPSSTSAFVYPVLQTLEEVEGGDRSTYGAPYAPSAQELGSMRLSSCITPQNAVFGVGKALQDCGLTVPSNPAGVEVLPQPAQLPVVTEAQRRAEMEAQSGDNIDAPARAVPALMVNTLQGVVYDMSNWASLPQESSWDKLKYIFTRDGRPHFLLLWGLIMLLVLLVAAML